MAKAEPLTATLLLERLSSDPAYRDKLQPEQLELVRSAAFDILKDHQPVLQSDPWIYRIVVALLGSTVLSVAIGVLIIVAHATDAKSVEVPAVLTALGSAAVGALAGLLSPTSAR